MLRVATIWPRGVFACAHIETKVLSTYHSHRRLIHGSTQSKYLLLRTDSLRKIMNAEFPGSLGNDRNFIQCFLLITKETSCHHP